MLQAILFSMKNTMAQPATFVSSKWGLEADYMGGRFLKHGTSYVPTDISNGFELSYFKKTLGDKPWHRGMNYPEVGATFTYFHFADNKVFGDAFAVLASAKFYLVRSRIADFYIRLSSGYGIVTRRYNATDNPFNTLLSSPAQYGGHVAPGP